MGLSRNEGYLRNKSIILLSPSTWINLYFCTSTCLMRLVFVVEGSWTCIFTYSFSQPQRDSVIPGKSRRTLAEVPATCGRLTLRVGLYALFHQLSASWNTWLVKRNESLWSRLQDSVIRMGVHTSGPISLLLGCRATWASCHLGPVRTICSTSW